MGRSRESVRQNKAMQQILRGETPEKRIFVAMEDTNEKKERQKEPPFIFFSTPKEE